MIRVAREAWRTRAMSSTSAATIQSLYGAEFTQEDHFARADMFLWRRDTASAQALLPKLSSGRKAVVAARVALIRNTKQIDKLVGAVPQAYADDAGLLYDRARHAERRNRDADELSLLLRINGEGAPEVGRENIWDEKQSVVRRMIRERNYATAYQLAAGHGLSGGEAFRDAEWMAGWLALSKLGDAKKAEIHFTVFGAGVQTPISIARAQYWLGEALSAQGRKDEAQAAYEAGAKYPFVFYGQLAAEKAGVLKPELKMLNLGSHTAPTDEERAEFARRPAVRASILLAEAGRLASFERFHFALDDVLTTSAEHQMLFDIAAGYLEMRAAVRGAKAGLGRGIVAPDAVFPVLPLPNSPRSGAAEPAMVLALTRQESEFNHRAISSADARGLMQMIPRYAQAEARMVGATAAPWVSATRINGATSDLRRQGDDVARAALPDASRIVDAKAQLREASLPHERTVGALNHATSILEGLARTSGVQLSRLELGADGVMHASLSAADLSQLQPLRDHIAQLGLRSAETPGESRPNSLSINFTVTDAR